MRKRRRETRITIYTYFAFCLCIFVLNFSIWVLPENEHPFSKWEQMELDHQNYVHNAWATEMRGNKEYLKCVSLLVTVQCRLLVYIL
jgi:hypothetical protein